MTVALEGNDGKVYGQTEISGSEDSLGAFSGVIQSTATDPTARLTISTKRSGTFWINMVSLRNDGNHLRCRSSGEDQGPEAGVHALSRRTYVQGKLNPECISLEATIGNRNDAPGHQDTPWSYWSTDHMGYHEYLLLCERLGAAPTYVADAGMTWTPNSKSPFGVRQDKIPVDDYPMDQMGPIVQETLDAIEYANGPATSKWGALRAKAGHPAPFGLKYVEIGNEDGNNPLYNDRYILFYKAIKAKYPEIRVIANARRGGNGQLPMDFVDEHSYARPLAALDMGQRLMHATATQGRARRVCRTNIRRYGEHACGAGGSRDLSGIERNSEYHADGVLAPMLANVHAINWRPDLIYFDGVVIRTPSYYVQKNVHADSRLDLWRLLR